MAVKNPGLRTVSDWIELIKDTNSALHEKLGQIYADNGSLKDRAAQMCLQTLEAFGRAIARAAYRGRSGWKWLKRRQAAKLIAGLGSCIC